MNNVTEPIRLQNFISSKGMRADRAEVEGEVIEEAIVCERCDPEDDEARAPKIARRPYVPTKAEIDAHFRWHADSGAGASSVYKESQ